MVTAEKRKNDILRMKNVDRILSVKNLAIGYKKGKDRLIVADNISFEMNRGKFVGLVGANGIGKSTLLRTLSGIQNPLSGEIIINDKKVAQLSAVDRAKMISLVLTEGISSKNLSIDELVSLGRHPYTNWIGEMNTKDEEIVLNSIRQVGLDEIKAKKCFELSDGQMQKVMIARALAQDTDIIILDEPTTHLDLYHKSYILSLLKDISVKTLKTILFSSHEIDLSLQLCDELIMILPGKVVFGKPDDLINQGYVDKLFPQDLVEFSRELNRFIVKK